MGQTIDERRAYYRDLFSCHIEGKLLDHVRAALKKDNIKDNIKDKDTYRLKNTVRHILLFASKFLIC